MLILSRKVGETVYLNEDIEIKIVEVSGASSPTLVL